MSTIVIGIGNRDRSDDAVGPLIIDELVGRLPEAAVIAHEGDLSHLPLLWSSGDDVVLVDAVVDEGIEAGALRVLDPGDIARCGLLSTHGVGLAEALALADRLGRRPHTVRVLGIGARTVDLGDIADDLRERIPSLADEVARIASGAVF